MRLRAIFGKASLIMATVLVVGGCGPQEKPDHLDSIDSADLDRHIQALASDQFEGRAPSSKGEQLTLDYLQSEFSKMGLKPGFNGSYRQPVNLVSITAEPANMRFTTEEREIELTYGTEVMQWTTRVVDSVTVEDSELVFVGYGIDAPEHQWNDFADVDLKGKTLLVLVNDPGYATQDQDLFKGNAMTRYGRWTYKFEEAARQGATAAIIIHDTLPAAYPWEVVEHSWSGQQFHLATPDKNLGHLNIEAWITREKAAAILALSGHDLDNLEQQALTGTMQPVATGIKVSSALQNSIAYSTSYNVVAKYQGKRDEAVIFTAHWDHLGTDQKLIDEGEDGIFNGAVDNAAGVAALLELAESYANLPEQAERSALFVAVTAEESGLLGSKQYVATPPLPLSQTIAGINLDAPMLVGPTKDIIVVGHGSSELEELLTEEAEKMERVVIPELHPERGTYYRSDHVNFAKKGVPFLYLKSGQQHLTRGKGWTEEKEQAYYAEHYHKPSDEYDPNWDLSGLVLDLRLMFNLSYRIASSDSYPNWHEGNEFRAIRDRSMGAAKQASNIIPVAAAD